MAAVGLSFITVGRWQRRITGWEQTEQRDGTFDGSSRGGFKQRGWQTPWIKEKPYTVFSPLPEGQERVLLNLFSCIPRADGHKNLTLALDHNGSKVVAGVGGGFSFNQAYHELDVSELEVDDQGIRGTALLIINSDTWVPGDHRNGDSLAGTLTLDLRFGERAKDGTHPVSGSWSVAWGQAVTRSGPIEATIKRQP